jgi:hypothetical protein
MGWNMSDNKPAVTGVVDPTSVVAVALNKTGTTPENLEDQIKAVLAKMQENKREASKPKEPNWATVTEKDFLNPQVHIPIIEHDLPDYMNMKLKDAEYEVVWANRDQRRIGQLTATGYEFLKPEHVHPDFKCPLPFDSEKLYIYQDVVAMRVHKRILYGKRVKALQTSLNQLANRNRPPRVRVQNSFDLSESVGPQVGEFYETAI